MNIERMKIVRDAIAAKPELFNYRVFTEYQIPGQTFPRIADILAKPMTSECGSPGCVAGWTCALFPEKAMKIIGNNNRYHEIFETAQAILGLDIDQAEALFLLDPYEDLPNGSINTGTVQDAIDRLNYLIAKEEAE